MHTLKDFHQKWPSVDADEWLQVMAIIIDH